MSNGVVSSNAEMQKDAMSSDTPSIESRLRSAEGRLRRLWEIYWETDDDHVETEVLRRINLMSPRIHELRAEALRYLESQTNADSFSE